MIPLSSLVELIRDYQHALTMEKRVEFWAAIQEGYCKQCGYPDAHCPCEREE